MTLNQLCQKVAELGGKVSCECYGRRADLTAEAPSGMKWNANDCHTLVTGWNGTTTRPTWKQEKQDALDDLDNRIGYGTSPCNDPDCEYCHVE